jgi:hypothetical protein
VLSTPPLLPHQIHRGPTCRGSGGGTDEGAARPAKCGGMAQAGSGVLDSEGRGSSWACSWAMARGANGRVRVQACVCPVEGGPAATQTNEREAECFKS